MRFLEALEIRKKDIVSLVGAGGKTTIMFALGKEAGEVGLKTILTTTTKINYPVEHNISVIVSDQRDTLVSQVKKALAETNVIVVGKRIEAISGSASAKLIGLDYDMLSALGATDADLIVVEADGAAGRAFKAPADHEPVIPLNSTIVIPVVGVDCIGQPLNAEYAHRPEAIAAITGVEIGAIITPEMVAQVFTCGDGYRKGMPPQARWIPFINKADTEADLSLAREIAMQVKKQTSATVLIGATRDVEPVREARGNVTAIVLAAGLSSRLGAPKQLLSFQGRPLIRHVAEAVLGSQIDEVIVVLGFAAESVSQALKGLPVKIVVNQDFAQGQSTSVTTGVNALNDKILPKGVLFVLGDQPLLQSATINLIVDQFSKHGGIVVPYFNKTPGNPVIFDHKYLPEFQELRGDVGARVIIQRHSNEVYCVDVTDRGVLFDIDTPEDYQRLTQS
jgi:molybdenum cofactor cytidylyltransferase